MQLFISFLFYISISMASDNGNRIIVNVDTEIELRGIGKLTGVNGEIITSDNMNDYNDFGQPEKVNIKSFSEYQLENNTLKISLPSKSVVTLEIQQ